MKEFHRHDVTHGDLACRNVILVEESTSSDQAYEIVYLDWAQAKRVQSDPDWMTDSSGFDNVVTELGWCSDTHPICDWFGQQEGGAHLMKDLYLPTKPTDVELEQAQARMQRENEAFWNIPPECVGWQ